MRNQPRPNRVRSSKNRILRDNPKSQEVFDLFKKHGVSEEQFQKMNIDDIDALIVEITGGRK